MKKKTFLITGGTGFIGSNISKLLVNKNYNVIIDSADPTFQFAKMLIQNISVANKKKTLEKARGLAANIHY